MPPDFGLRPRRYSSTRGSRLLLRRRRLRLSPSSTQFDSRGSPSTTATTTSAFSLVDIGRLEGLAFYFGDLGLHPRQHSSTQGARLLLQRRRLWPSPASKQFDMRASPSTSAMTTSAFALVDTARLEGFAFYFGNDYSSLSTMSTSSTTPLEESLMPPLRTPAKRGYDGATVD